MNTKLIKLLCLALIVFSLLNPLAKATDLLKIERITPYNTYLNLSGLMYVSSTNVGIGTANPLYTLDVTGMGRFTSTLYANSNIRVDGGTTPNIFFDAAQTGDIAIRGNGENLEIYEPEDANKVWARFTDDDSLHLIGTPNLYVDGFVGIGTTSPAYNLDVYGTIRATSNIRSPIFYDSDDTNYYLNPQSESNLKNLSVQNLTIKNTLKFNDASSLNSASDTTFLNKIKNVDGSGSGLNADYLDGKDSSVFPNIITSSSELPVVKKIVRFYKTSKTYNDVFDIVRIEFSNNTLTFGGTVVVQYWNGAGTSVLHGVFSSEGNGNDFPMYLRGTNIAKSTSGAVGDLNIL